MPAPSEQLWEAVRTLKESVSDFDNKKISLTNTNKHLLQIVKSMDAEIKQLKKKQSDLTYNPDLDPQFERITEECKTTQFMKETADHHPRLFTEPRYRKLLECLCGICTVPIGERHKYEEVRSRVWEIVGKDPDPHMQMMVFVLWHACNVFRISESKQRSDPNHLALLKIDETIEYVENHAFQGLRMFKESFTREHRCGSNLDLRLGDPDAIPSLSNWPRVHVQVPEQAIGTPRNMRSVVAPSRAKSMAKDVNLVKTTKK